MDKVYLKYDDVRPCVVCDFGFAPKLVIYGFIYPYLKKDLRFSLVMFFLQLAVCTLLIILVPVDVIFKIIMCLLMIMVINILFAFNYNLMVIEKLLKEGYYPMDYGSSDKLIKKGIYFKLK